MKTPGLFLVDVGQVMCYSCPQPGCPRRFFAVALSTGLTKVTLGPCSVTCPGEVRAYPPDLPVAEGTINVLVTMGLYRPAELPLFDERNGARLWVMQGALLVAPLQGAIRLCHRGDADVRFGENLRLAPGEAGKLWPEVA